MQPSGGENQSGKGRKSKGLWLRMIARIGNTKAKWRTLLLGKVSLFTATLSGEEDREQESEKRQLQETFPLNEEETRWNKQTKHMKCREKSFKACRLIYQLSSLAYGWLKYVALNHKGVLSRNRTGLYSEINHTWQWYCSKTLDTMFIILNTPTYCRPISPYIN